MFVDTSVGSGLVILGIGIASRMGAFAAWSGATVACLVSYYLMKVPDLINVRNGLFGYNSAGCCASLAGGVFFQVNRGNFITGLIGAGTAVLLLTAFQSVFGHLWGLPVLTFPFITSTWIMIKIRSDWLIRKPRSVHPDAEFLSFLGLGGYFSVALNYTMDDSMTEPVENPMIPEIQSKL